MGRIPRAYLINRLITLFLTVWIAATLIWIIPRLSPVDPAEIMLGRMMAGAGTVAGSEEILATLQERFGLNDPLIVQYAKYLRNVLLFDFGLSTASFPAPVSALIAQALPWTIGLMLISIIITFVIGGLVALIWWWHPWEHRAKTVTAESSECAEGERGVKTTERLYILGIDFGESGSAVICVSD